MTFRLRAINQIVLLIVLLLELFSGPTKSSVRFRPQSSFAEGKPALVIPHPYPKYKTHYYPEYNTIWVSPVPLPVPKDDRQYSLTHHKAACGRTAASACHLLDALRFALPHSTLRFLPGTYYGAYRVTVPLRMVADGEVFFDGEGVLRPLWFDNVPASLEGFIFINGYGETAGGVLVTRTQDDFREINFFVNVSFLNCTGYAKPGGAHEIAAGGLAVIYKRSSSRPLAEILKGQFERNYVRSKDRTVAAGGILFRYGMTDGPTEAAKGSKATSAQQTATFPFPSESEERALATTDFTSSYHFYHPGFTTTRLSSSKSDCLSYVLPRFMIQRGNSVGSAVLHRFLNWTIDGYPVYSTRRTPPRVPSALTAWMVMCSNMNKINAKTDKAWVLVRTTGEVNGTQSIDCTKNDFAQVNPYSVPIPSPDGTSAWLLDRQLSGPMQFYCQDFGNECPVFTLRRVPGGSPDAFLATGTYKVTGRSVANRPIFQKVEASPNGQNYFFVYHDGGEKWILTTVEPVGATTVPSPFVSFVTESLHPAHVPGWTYYDVEGTAWKPIIPTLHRTEMTCIPKPREDQYCRIIAMRGMGHQINGTHPYILQNYTYGDRPVWKQSTGPFHLWYCQRIAEWIISLQNPFRFDSAEDEDCSRATTSANTVSVVPYDGIVWLELMNTENGTAWDVNPELHCVCVEDSSSISIHAEADWGGIYHTIGIMNGTRVYRMREGDPRYALIFDPHNANWRIQRPEDAPISVQILMQASDMLVPKWFDQLPSGTEEQRASAHMVALGTGGGRPLLDGYELATQRYLRPFAVGSCGKLPSTAMMQCHESPLAITDWVELRSLTQIDPSTGPKFIDRFVMSGSTSSHSACITVQVLSSPHYPLLAGMYKLSNLSRSNRPVYSQFLEAEGIPIEEIRHPEHLLYFCSAAKRWTFGLHNPYEWVMPTHMQSPCNTVGIASGITVSYSPVEAPYVAKLEQVNGPTKWIEDETTAAVVRCVQYENQRIEERWEAARRRESFEYSYSPKDRLTNVTFINNKGHGEGASAAAGGAVFFEATAFLGEDHSVAMKNVRFTMNHADVAVDNRSSLLPEESHSAAAAAFFNGFLQRPHVALEDVKVTKNSGPVGGMLFSGVWAKLQRVQFTKNHGFEQGGGLHNQRTSNATLTMCTCLNNNGFRGGCVSADSRSETRFVKSEVTDNVASSLDGHSGAGGKLIFAEGSKLQRVLQEAIAATWLLVADSELYCMNGKPATLLTGLGCWIGEVARRLGPMDESTRPYPDSFQPPPVPDQEPVEQQLDAEPDETLMDRIIVSFNPFLWQWSWDNLTNICLRSAIFLTFFKTIYDTIMYYRAHHRGDEEAAPVAPQAANRPGAGGNRARARAVQG
jgi:hypothetical protein